VNLYIPSKYDGQTPIPLMILLHGYTSSGADEESYWQIQSLAEARGFLYCYPDGTIDLSGNQFWNATDAVDGFGNTGVDDAGYLAGLIEEIEKQSVVDRKRVYLMGHSNGGFMVYRMACQFSSLVAGIASLAGGTYLDPSQCAPAEPVNILQIHGTADSIVPYGGGAVTTALGFPGNTPALPGALWDILIWAAYTGASDPVTDEAPSLDLTTDVAGLDTVVTRYTSKPPGGSVELWAINGGTHSPTLSSHFSTLVIDWLLAHPKP
jgi:polyhydroxybutyrate depolymerase